MNRTPVPQESERRFAGAIEASTGSPQFTLPEAIKAGYYEAGYWRHQTLWESFVAIADVNPAATAFVDGERLLTFDELKTEATRVGRAMIGSGLRAGDVVAIHGRHGLESAISILACARAGLVVALLPHMFAAEQIRGVIQSSRATLLISLGEPAEVAHARQALSGTHLAGFVVPDTRERRTQANSRSEVSWSEFVARGKTSDEVPRAFSADDLALLIFSSGTTGAPKGVMHSANTIRFTVEAYSRCQSIVAADTSLVVTAFGFVGSSILGTYLTYLRGCKTILQRNWSATDTLALIEKHRVTHLLLMPTHAIDILASPTLDDTDCSSLARGVIAGVNESQRLEAARRLCARPYPMYGMSESPGHVTGRSDDDIHDLRTTEGRPLPGTELLICDDDGCALPAGTKGNILVRGPNRFLGYYRNEALNRAAFTDDGFFRTGDLGILGDNGCLIFSGRSKDIIRRGGVTITPADVENALRPYPRLTDVAVIALPDTRLGERACACVIPRDGLDVTLAELTEFLEAQGFPRYLWPESVAVCTIFPRTPSLKVQKAELQRQILLRQESRTMGNEPNS